jgi:hypothetical protein
VLPTTSASVTGNGSDIAVAENATATRLCTPGGLTGECCSSRRDELL